MSRTFAFAVVLAALAAGGGVAWFYLRPRPSEFDVAAKPLPELPPLRIAPGDWPWWRGPTYDNRAPAATAPRDWAPNQNILWKTAIPGRGHSSPIVVGSRIFLTSADEGTHRQLALALDRTTGAVVWQKSIHEGNLPAMHADNSHASATPACDGERVYVAFDNNAAVMVSALNFDGKILWQKEAGLHRQMGSHGFAASPVLWGPYVIVSNDASSPGWIAALNRQTGEIGWRATRRTGIGSYGAPIVAQFGGQDMVLLAGNGSVTAYDPKDGRVIWDRSGLGEASGNTVAVSPNLAFASSGYPERNLLALRPDGSIAWKVAKKNEVPYPPSLLFNDASLYCVSDTGVATCYAAETGEVKWQESRFGGSFYASPLLVGDAIYACDRHGETRVFKASPDSFDPVARNKLDGPINASPVPVDGKLLIRTDAHLYCIGK